MRITIVVPSFNQGAYLEACLESVLRQRRSGIDVELLVYDGGSTDGSRDIIARYSPQLTYWQSEPDGGQARALRLAFERATGEILGWLNSDDLLLPGALHTMARWFDQNPASVMVYGDAVWIDGAGKILRPKREIPFDWKIFAFGYCYLAQPSTFFRREAYVRVGGIDPGFECSMDYDLWHRLVRLGPVGHLPSFLSAIRSHPGTKTNRLQRRFRLEHEVIRKRHLRCGRVSYGARHIVQRCRRVLLRFLHGCYSPLDARERSQCVLIG